MIIGTHRRLGAGLNESELLETLEPITYNGEVDVFGSLPPAAAHSNEIYNVASGSGIWPFNNPGGLYVSDGVTWTREGNSSGVIQGQIDVTVDALAMGAVAANAAALLTKADVNHAHTLSDITDFDASNFASSSLFDQSPTQTTDWDTATTPGVYFANGSVANGPPGFNNFERGFTFEATPSNGLILIQHVYDGATGSMAARRRHFTAGWSDWAVYTSTADIPALVSASETDTTLAIVGTDLVYTGEDGVAQVLPLSLFGEDDTNLARIVSAELGDFFTLTLTRDDATQINVDLSNLATNVTNTSVGLDASNILTITDSNSNTVTTDLSSLDNTAAITALAMGAVAMNAAALLTKADVNHTHVEADITDLDKYTQAETDALLGDKSAVGHTHVEADITDLDKYTQSEVDALLENRPQLVDSTINIFVAPDAASAQPGDFIGGDGIFDAIAETSNYIMRNPFGLIRIFLRDGEYTIDRAIEIVHPQGPKLVQLRAATLTGTATSQAVDTQLTDRLTDQAADDAVLASNYGVIINCLSHAIFVDKGTGIDTVDSIMFRYIGTNTSRVGVFSTQQGSATILRCAFIGFPFGVRTLEAGTVGLSIGNFFLYCVSSAVRVEEEGALRLVHTANYRYRFHSVTAATMNCLSSGFMRVVATASGTVNIYNDTTNRAAVQLAGASRGTFTRIRTFGGDEGLYVLDGSHAIASSFESTDNSGQFMRVESASNARVTNATADATLPDAQRTVNTEDNSFTRETGTHSNVIFVPALGTGTDSSITGS